MTLSRYLRAASAVVLAFCVLPVAAAFAYHTDGRENKPGGGTYACIACHGDDRDAWTGEGPHGYFHSATDKCQMCHRAMHSTNDKLLPATTITDTCYVCHDHTGAVGVYSAITSGGDSVGAEHTVDMTTAIPGGSPAMSEKLGCRSCHSVHRNTVMAAYLRDTGKAFFSTDWITSNNLLQDDVNGAAKGTYTIYGSSWCGGCHNRRMSGGAVNNHPTSQTAAYDLGRSNDGYSMDPVGTAMRRPPICMECHEDSRNVESTFSASFKNYGYPPPDAPTNPKYIRFPHQTQNQYFLVERQDDLCLNCHRPQDLP